MRPANAPGFNVSRGNPVGINATLDIVQNCAAFDLISESSFVVLFFEPTLFGDYCLLPNRPFPLLWSLALSKTLEASFPSIFHRFLLVDVDAPFPLHPAPLSN